MKEALLYKSLDDQKVQCLTCAHRCILPPNKKGICGVRQNLNGKLHTLVYGKAIATHVDPIEKKPLFHFLPGSRAFSIASVGCNMHCLNCQNSDISQMPKERMQILGNELPPEEAILAAEQMQCQVIAYTYTEPAVFWDYTFDMSKIAREKGLKNIIVSNGYFSDESLEKIAPFMDGGNIDLKFFSDKMYKEICGAHLQPVLNTIQKMHELGIWLEITTLLIPGLNDSENELRDIARFIKSVHPGIPWHISRFHPTYKMTDRPPTSVKAVQRAREIGYEEGLRYVITGNIPGDEGENTYCPKCKDRIIHRMGYQIIQNNIVDGHCPNCHAQIDGVFI